MVKVWGFGEPASRLITVIESPTDRLFNWANCSLTRHSSVFSNARPPTIARFPLTKSSLMEGWEDARTLAFSDS